MFFSGNDEEKKLRNYHLTTMMISSPKLIFIFIHKICILFAFITWIFTMYILSIRHPVVMLNRWCNLEQCIRFAFVQ